MKHKNLINKSKWPIVVVKFGSSVLTSTDDIANVVHEIYRHVRQGNRVIAIVSAIGDSTDVLFEEAHQCGGSPKAELLANHVALGEQDSASRIALALDRAGIACAAESPHTLALRTEGPILNARPISICANRLNTLFEHHSVVVVPGYIGVDDDARITLLGRGGSDLSAVFIAHELQAKRCILYKDVDGLYDRDPKNEMGDLEDSPQRFSSIAYEDALRLDDSILQAKAVLYGFRKAHRFEVAGLNQSYSTQVGGASTVFASTVANPSGKAIDSRPLQVALLGFGTVGSAVYRHLLQYDREFEVRSILVRERDCERDGILPEHAAVLTTDPEQAIPHYCDIVIEAIGGTDLANELITESLSSGQHVITANKDVIATHGQSLRTLADDAGCTLQYSAAIGGALPVLETVKAIRRLSNDDDDTIERIETVINGTTNFVLDRIIAGRSYAGAVSEAQQSGFAEADPTADVEGLDAAYKLCILAHHAFGKSITLEDVDRIGITQLDVDEVRRAATCGRIVRLVATCERQPRTGTLNATVRPVWLDHSHPLARCRAEGNAALITTSTGESHCIEGKGAGGWPTAEAVFADALSLARSVVNAHQSVFRSSTNFEGKNS